MVAALGSAPHGLSRGGLILMLAAMVRLTDPKLIGCHGGFRKITMSVDKGTCVHRNVDLIVVAHIVEGDFFVATVAPLPLGPLVVGVRVITSLIFHVSYACLFLFSVSWWSLLFLYE